MEHGTQNQTAWSQAVSMEVFLHELLSESGRIKIKKPITDKRFKRKAITLMGIHVSLITWTSTALRTTAVDALSTIKNANLASSVINIKTAVDIKQR